MGAFDAIRFVLNILRAPTYDAGRQPSSILYANVHPALEGDDVVFDAWEGGGLAAVRMADGLAGRRAMRTERNVL